MARLLVKAQDRVQVDLSVDTANSLKTGMVVSVRDDTDDFGAKESLPEFIRFYITGAVKQQCLFLTQEGKSEALIEKPFRRSGRLFHKKRRRADQETTIKRRYKLDINGFNIVNGEVNTNFQYLLSKVQEA